MRDADGTRQEAPCTNRICGNVCHGDGPLETLLRKIFGSYNNSSHLLTQQHYKQQRLRKKQQQRRKNSFDNYTENEADYNNTSRERATGMKTLS